MKKKTIIIWIIIIAAAVIGIYLLTRPTVLGNMKNSYTEQITTASDISFSGEAGERIKFSFRSNIVNGELNMVLYDSAGNVVYTLDEAKALETFYTLDSSGTYTLAAECKDFIGEYKIKVYKAD